VLPSGEYPTAINRCRWSEDIKKAIFPSQEIKGNKMKTKRGVVIDWCKENELVYLTYCYGGAIVNYRFIHGAAEENVKRVIGGFDAQRNYYKLPDDIFKVKVTKSKEGYMARNGNYIIGAAYIGGERDIISYGRSCDVFSRKVTITWEEEEEIK